MVFLEWKGWCSKKVTSLMYKNALFVSNNTYIHFDLKRILETHIWET